MRRSRHPRTEASQPHVRGSGGHTDFRTRRPPRSSRCGEGTARAEGPDQWRGGRRGVVRGADCQVVRSGSNRRVQHEECRHGRLDRRRPCHRLHAGGFRSGWPWLRSHLRQRGEPLPIGLQMRAHAQRHSCAQQRSGGAGNRNAGSSRQAARVVTARAPKPAPVSFEAESRGFGRSERARRIREAHAKARATPARSRRRRPGRSAGS